MKIGTCEICGKEKVLRKTEELELCISCRTELGFNCFRSQYHYMPKHKRGGNVHMNGQLAAPTPSGPY